MAIGSATNSERLSGSRTQQQITAFNQPRMMPHASIDRGGGDQSECLYFYLLG
ncbi:unnamed protein product [Penicillium roqueforti FM164]|uniref:Genomic scaffold, ProqFM164S04 n=1 Tax=Penicillium roqueforti (strain FM164) TaxID=1365484 RepID=W6QEN0_PENRF|nr:unnamed protein product [Penicillium roqueforti FM164]